MVNGLIGRPGAAAMNVNHLNCLLELRAMGKDAMKILLENGSNTQREIVLNLNLNMEAVHALLKMVWGTQK